MALAAGSAMMQIGREAGNGASVSTSVDPAEWRRRQE